MKKDELERDTVARSVASARPDDEPVTDEDRRRFLAGGSGTPMEEVLAEFGLRPEDFPLKP